MKTGAVAITAPRDRLADFVALTKPRLNSLVVVTTGVGYLAGRVEGFDPVVFAHTTVGAALVAGGAAALNQIAERDLDERMLRTRDRPIPAGRLHPAEATWVAVLLAVAGLAQLAFGANLTAAVVAFVTLVSYAGIYTPMDPLGPAGRRGPWRPAGGHRLGRRRSAVGRCLGAVRPRLRLAVTALLGSELAVSRRLRTGRSAATVDIRPQRAPHRAAPARLHGPPVAGQPDAGVAWSGWAGLRSRCNDSHDRSALPRNAVRRQPIHRPSPCAVQGDPPVPAARLGTPAD